jgi:glutathione-regulated potassium-efflux system ancillary protein KefC
MAQFWLVASLWLDLALFATLRSIWLRISTGLSEIGVGTGAQSIIGALINTDPLDAKSAWIAFLSDTDAIVLTFSAGAELDPTIFRNEVETGFPRRSRGLLLSVFGRCGLSGYPLRWIDPASWRPGIAFSTMSVAVAYTVTLSSGLTQTQYSIISIAIANAFFMPKYLIPRIGPSRSAAEAFAGAWEEDK